MARLTTDQHDRILTWLEENQHGLQAARVTVALAHEQARSATGITFSRATFSRVMLYARCCGRLREWRGFPGGRGDMVGQQLMPWVVQ